MKYLLYHGHLVVDDKREFLDGALLIEDDKISDVFLHSSKIPPIEDCMPIDLGGLLLMPGFFDSHVYGSDGLVFDTADKQEFDQISAALLKKGTTTFLAALTGDPGGEKLYKQLHLLNDYVSPNARFGGVYLVGPFLSRSYPGTLKTENFCAPDLELTKSFLKECGCIRAMSIAYELPGAEKTGRYLHEQGIKVMCGHSEAVAGDLDENVDGFSHLFEAMRPLDHHEETLVNCAFENRWPFELAADGKDIADNVLHLVLRSIDQEWLMLVSGDRGEPAVIDEMKVLYRLGGKYCDLLQFSGLNAYRFYGLDERFGTLQKGKYSDIVIMDDDLDIRRVMCGGKFYDV